MLSKNKFDLIFALETFSRLSAGNPWGLMDYSQGVHKRQVGKTSLLSVGLDRERSVLALQYA